MDERYDRVVVDNGDAAVRSAGVMPACAGPSHGARFTFGYIAARHAANTDNLAA